MSLSFVIPSLYPLSDELIQQFCLNLVEIGSSPVTPTIVYTEVFLI